MTKPHQTKGRQKNAAQPLGERQGVASSSETKRTGRKSRTQAGPDGPSAKAIGDTFKK